MPLHRVADVHIAGIKREGLYHDTHAHPVTGAVLELLEEVCRRVAVPGVLLERDACFPAYAELTAEVEMIVAGDEARCQPQGRPCPWLNRDRLAVQQAEARGGADG